MHGFIIIFALLLGLIPSSNSWAVPTVETAQNEVDRLRTLAAEKFEAANEATTVSYTHLTLPTNREV